MTITEPKISGVIRHTAEYALAVHAMGNGENVEIPMGKIDQIKRPSEALLQALRRYILRYGLPYKVYCRENVVYVRRKQS